MQGRFRETVGEQAEARDIGCPAPARRTEIEYVDDQRVPRVGAVDVDGSGERVDPGGIHPLEVIEARVGAELAA